MTLFVNLLNPLYKHYDFVCLGIETKTVDVNNILIFLKINKKTLINVTSTYPIMKKKNFQHTTLPNRKHSNKPSEFDTIQPQHRPKHTLIAS